jgi:hypothetical protein
LDQVASALAWAALHSKNVIEWIDNVIKQYKSATFLHESPRHIGAALNGPKCSALGYRFR